MNTPDEIHAFVIGFFESLCPWPPRWGICPRDPSPLKGEYHYYLAGRGTGFITLLLVLLGLIKIAKEVIPCNGHRTKSPR